MFKTKNFVLSLAFIIRFKATRKWPIEMFYVTFFSTHNYNHSLQGRPREVRESFHDVGCAFQLNIAANPPRVIVLNFQLVNNNRATLNAVSTKQRQIVVHMLLAVARKI